MKLTFAMIAWFRSAICCILYLVAEYISFMSCAFSARGERISSYSQENVTGMREKAWEESDEMSTSRIEDT